MNQVTRLVLENEYNSENFYIIRDLVKEIGNRLSGEHKELESVEVDREGHVHFGWEDSLVDDYDALSIIKDEFFELFAQEVKMFHPELF